MKITILCENTVAHTNAKICSAEWGLSVYLEMKKTNVLFDTGHTDIYWNNAQRMGVNLHKTHFVILSHHHWDHSGGLQYHHFRNRKKLILHPDIIPKLSLQETTKINTDFEIVESRQPLEFSKGIYFLGEVPRITAFEKGTYQGQPILDDTALAVQSKNGAVVISGCSHSGIVNICEYAKKVTGQKLYAVLGGFHLSEKDKEAITGTIAYFQREKPTYLYPMHCVDFPVLAWFYASFQIQKLSAGDIITISC